VIILQGSWVFIAAQVDSLAIEDDISLARGLVVAEFGGGFGRFGVHGSFSFPIKSKILFLALGYGRSANISGSRK
jgi:hypothetical protein